MPGAPSLRVPTTLLIVLLGLETASWLPGVRLPALSIAGELSSITAILALWWWMYRARNLAGRGDWPQRRPRSWAVGGWIALPYCLWVPFQAMADIWRASQPAAERTRSLLLLRLWWATWLASPLLPCPAAPCTRVSSRDARMCHRRAGSS